MSEMLLMTVHVPLSVQAIRVVADALDAIAAGRPGTLTIRGATDEMGEPCDGFEFVLAAIDGFPA